MATTTACRPKVAAHREISDGSATAAVFSDDLVGAGAENRPHLVDAPHAATDRQRDERPASGPLDDLEQRGAALGGGRDVEEDELVGAFGCVARGELGRIALVDEVDEAGALDDPAGRHVEARDHAAAEHQARTSAASVAGADRLASTSATKFASSRRPSVPLRSGWNWTPRREPAATAETKGRPWVVSARTVSPASPGTAPAYEWTK